MGMKWRTLSCGFFSMISSYTSVLNLEEGGRQMGYVLWGYVTEVAHAPGGFSTSSCLTVESIMLAVEF